MLTDEAREARAARREIRRLTSPDRYVDMGVLVYVVKQDADTGAVVIPGLAPVVALSTFALGGVWDTVTRQYVGESEKPKIWYASEQAASVIQHSDDLPDGLLLEAGMGSGKTVGYLSPWIVAQALRLGPFAGQRGIEIGATSPTDPRLEEYIAAIRDKMRPSWYRYEAKAKVFHLFNGVRIRCLGTARRSASQGSRVQGWNWAAHGADEHQDNSEERDHMDARGRRAPAGRYKQVATATPKPSPIWRETKARMLNSGEWDRVHIPSRSNPFVWPQYWEARAKTMSERTYAMMVDGIDLGPEHATYPSWRRDTNLRPVPQVGAHDVTQQVIGAAALLGSDPGSSVDVTLMLKLYQIGHRLQQWYVVDEWTTRDETSQAHVFRVRAALREKWDLNWPEPDMPQVLVRLDPMGDSNNKTHESVYKTWKHAGFNVKSATYDKRGQPHGIIHIDAGIEMVNRLLRNAAGQSRLFVACDDRMHPAAPKLVEALEMSERDIHGKAETAPKGSSHDLSHWCAALRYALWPYEKLRNPPPSRRAGRRILL